MSNIMGYFRKSKNALEKGGITLKNTTEEKVRCPICKSYETRRAIAKQKVTCPHCGHHFRIGARTRIKALCDKDSFHELFSNIETIDPLEFPGYQDKMDRGRAVSGEEEGVVCGIAKIRHQRCAVFVMEPGFMMGSMGSVVGEKIARLFEYAAEHELPVVGFTASGGARMQEGILSLMQMAKTSGAVEQHSKKGGLYITVLTDPTTGGVTASFAMLGDIILSEPNATIGFAGRRVIEQTTKKKLPEDFQKAEFLLEHGFIDRIVERGELKQTLSDILRVHRAPGKGRAIAEAQQPQKAVGRQLQGTGSDKTAWERVQLSRDKKRPRGHAYIAALFEDFYELHGDRLFADDPAVLGGIATFLGRPVTVISQEKDQNFGMCSPDGYRKALRLMKQAEKFRRPIFTFIDTAGAYPGLEAEEHGQGEAIARNLFEMSRLTVPVIAVVTGEGNSGGALALAVADRVLMLENAVYAILSPEGFASILWKDAQRSGEAAELMKLTAPELKKLGVIDGIVREPEGGAQTDPSRTLWNLDRALTACLEPLLKESAVSLTERRYQKFRALGRGKEDA